MRSTRAPSRAARMQIQPTQIDQESFWVEANTFVVKYEFDSAEKVYRQALLKHPNHPQILDALGAVLLQKGDFPGAKQIFTISMLN
jgi:Tfp pilus assembly protein PilF